MPPPPIRTSPPASPSKCHRADPSAGVFVLAGRGHCEAPAPTLLALVVAASLCMLTMRAHLGDALFLTSASWDFVPGGASGTTTTTAAGSATERHRGLLSSRKDFVTSSRRLVRETLGLASESDGHRAEGAFVMLVGPRATRGLALALQSLAVNVLAFHPRPVLLFYGDDIEPEEYTPEVLDELVPTAIRNLIEVIALKDWFTKLPESMRLVALHDIAAEGKYPGYQQMCRWNLVGLPNHPRIRELDYYCRLDTDSRINAPLRDDIFDYMADNQLHYGYVKMSNERNEWSRGMWDFAGDWLHTHLSKPAQYRALNNGFWDIHKRAHNDTFNMPWNEIEVVHVQRFIKADIADFTEAVDATNHIFGRRWGDSPLRYLQCMMFLDYRNETRKLDFVDYKHDKGNRWQLAPAAAPSSTGDTAVVA